MRKIPIVIDTDPGMDDFFAIMLANSSDMIDIRAITTVGGNHTVDQTTRNALDIAHLFGIKTRIAKGAKKALMYPFGDPVVHVHGNNGLAEVQLDSSPQQIDEKPAWDVIFEEAQAAGGELVLVPIGPFTNVAIALLKYPQLKNMISRIVLMGGSAKQGNVRPYSEANATNDAYATHIVFKSGIPIVMVGLDVTMTAPVAVEKMAEMSSGNKKAIKDAVYKISKARNGEPFHDAVALACLINPEIMTHEQEAYVEAEYLSPLTRGQTVVDERGKLGRAPNTTVVRSINYDIYLDMLQKMFNYYNM